MNSLLLVSQLIIPQLPADVTEDNFIKETIKTFDCVAEVEEDDIVHTLDEKTGETTTKASLIVTVKDEGKVEACAEEVVGELDGLTLENVFQIIPAFVVSYDVPESSEGQVSGTR